MAVVLAGAMGRRKPVPHRRDSRHDAKAVEGEIVAAIAAAAYG
ncbi:MAG: hypothetical protein VW801_06240 [Candidatus Puniceispirillum sp.]